MRRLLPVLIIALCWTGLSFLTPESTLWRDSPEFIISAFYLDIAHPAGFPLYSTLANAFTLLPLGPISWRVNLFSTGIAVGVLVLTYLITLRLLQHLHLKRGVEQSLAILSSFLLILSPTFLEQAFAAEVYMLNCLLLQLITIIFFTYLKRRDLRAAVLAAFLAGLALGNHVVISLSYLPALLFVAWDWRVTRSIFIASLLSGLFGLFIYGYLPIRSSTSPPLNTGRADSLSGFIAHVSDARDREIKPEVLTNPQSKEPQFLSILKIIPHDFSQLTGEVNLLALILAGFGLVALAQHSRRLAIILAWSALSHWFFFRGWNPDPWIPIFWICTSLSAFGVGYALSNQSTWRHRKLISATCLTALVIAVLIQGINLTNLNCLTVFRNPSAALSQYEELLAKLPPDAVLLTERSRFPLQYLRTIEEYRSDVQLVHQPALLYPKFFSPIKLVSGSETFVSPHSDTGLLAPFINFITKRRDLFFEPYPVTNQRFAKIALMDGNGLTRIKKDTLSTFSPDFLASQTTTLSALLTNIKSLCKPLHPEARLALEADALSIADLLKQTGHLAEAIRLLSELCPLDGSNFCTVAMLNNLGTLFMQQRDYINASKYLLKALKISPQHLVVKQNLKASLEHLPTHAVSELFSSDIASIIKDDFVK